MRFLRYIKYIILALFVVILPYYIRHELSGMGDPWFCKYICPSGMVFGAFPLLVTNEFLRELIGMQFYIKTTIAIGVLLTSVFIFRFFCRVLCPLGAFYSFFNPIAFLKMNCDKTKCTNCGSCAAACNVQINPSTTPNSPECIRCGDCASVCKTQAISKLRYFNSNSREEKAPDTTSST
ncbi:MAG: 4Fe-4S binding protein [Treponema sp.]|nr:4Fe-4S binding protein [Treponema sp.]